MHLPTKSDPKNKGDNHANNGSTAIDWIGV